MRKNDESAKFGKTSLAAFILHCMVGILICLLLSFVFSLLIAGEKLSPSSINTVSFTSAFLGAVTASVLSAKKFGKTLITALMQGMAYFVMLYLLGTVMYSRLTPDEISPLIPLSCFAGALLGAVIAALFRRRRR